VWCFTAASLDAVDGSWSEWEDISPCSKTCGGGFKLQNRSCTEPSFSCGGVPCVGSDHRTVLCSEICCPGVCVCVWVGGEIVIVSGFTVMCPIIFPQWTEAGVSGRRRQSVQLIVVVVL